MTILVLLGFDFNIVTMFEILTDFVMLLNSQDPLRSCVLCVSVGEKGSHIVRTSCPRSRAPSFDLPLTLVNVASCCFLDGAGIHATWKESAKSDLVGAENSFSVYYWTPLKLKI